MAKNYYVILGVGTNATSAEIKAAYRRRSRELHPDVSGLESGPFQEIKEAYTVLSDRARRDRYDRETAGPVVSRRPRGPHRDPFAAPKPVRRPRRPQVRPPETLEVSLTDSFGSFHPSFEELFERWWSNFETGTRPKAERREKLAIEVITSPEEARRGGRVKIWIPTLSACPACGGHGGVGDFACWRCGGRGSVAIERPVFIDYPAGLRDGDIARISLESFGIDNFFLTVVFRIGREE